MKRNIEARLVFNELKKRKTFILRSHGNSMYPILKDNDFVGYKVTPFRQIRVNDIVLLRADGAYITHRVVYKNKTSVITKGDNNHKNDGYIKQENILAVVTKVVRNRRTFKPDDYYFHQSQVYLEEIIRVKTALEMKKVDYLFLKGLPLHLYYEHAIPRRLYADFDILVGRKDAGHTDRILRSLGFQSEKKKDYRQFQRFIGADWKEVSYYKRIGKSGVAVDLHFEITFLTHKTKNPFPELQKTAEILTQRFMQRRRFVRIEGDIYPIMEKNDLILYLFLHFLTHNFRGSYRLHLVESILKTEKVNWEHIFLLAKETSCALFLIAGLEYYESYFGRRIPAGVRRKYCREFRYVRRMKHRYMNDIDIFSESSDIGAERIRRAFYMFLLYDAPFWKKMLDVCRPGLVFHFITYAGQIAMEKLIKRYPKRLAI